MRALVRWRSIHVRIRATRRGELDGSPVKGRFGRFNPEGGRATYWIWNGHGTGDKGGCGRIGIELILRAGRSPGLLEYDDGDVTVAYFGAVLDSSTS